ncbi:hypothetical protein VP01_1087g5 [Puccinia sorghi]|uniref:DNA 3'-5' helicase n=1 Tax=Puccinia sorghi TaxID=27349 RepID=A0A0L6VTG3_9BASI|nr:hypothetical protein VP01_1087g5 [Puccinia sorghi]
MTMLYHHQFKGTDELLTGEKQDQGCRFESSTRTPLIKLKWLNFFCLLKMLAINIPKKILAYSNTDLKECKGNKMGVVLVLNPLEALGDSQELYLSPDSQSQLTGKRHLRNLTQNQDVVIVGPSYRNIGSALLNNNMAMILLMSATYCGNQLRHPPRRAQSALNLYYSSHHEAFTGFMQGPPPSLFPTLIYPCTGHMTWKVLQVLDLAQGNSGKNMRMGNKQNLIEDFSAVKVPIISSTLALGMGQNWRSVRQVIHLKQSGLPLICQMLGRAGRDGNPALTLLFMEPTRKGGKNCSSEFCSWTIDAAKDQMDALACTPVCLRVAFAVENM